MATPKRTRKSPGGKKKWKRAVEPRKRKGRVLKRMKNLCWVLSKLFNKVRLG